MSTPDTPSSSAGDEFAIYSSPSKRLLQADVECLLCGQLCGVIEAPLPTPLRKVFIPVGNGAAEPASGNAIHCGRCGGNVVIGEQRVIRKREDRINWELDRPRRGRPPRWLVVRREEDGLPRSTPLDPGKATPPLAARRSR